jgi:hypothetical protein
MQRPSRRRICFAHNRLEVKLGIQTNAWPINPHDFSSLLVILDKIKAYGYEGFETGFANVQSQSTTRPRRKSPVFHSSFAEFSQR